MIQTRSENSESSRKTQSVSIISSTPWRYVCRMRYVKILYSRFYTGIRNFEFLATNTYFCMFIFNIVNDSDSEMMVFVETQFGISSQVRNPNKMWNLWRQDYHTHSWLGIILGATNQVQCIVKSQKKFNVWLNDYNVKQPRYIAFSLVFPSHIISTVYTFALNDQTLWNLIQFLNLN